jgi:Zn-dependent protease
VSLDVLLLLLPVLVVSMSLHELAHAYVATRLGDPTPREHGRLTLNPIAHIDPLGTLMFVLTALLAPFIFGWAKPVLVDARYMRRPKQGMALVAVAGPVTNLAISLAFVAALVHTDLAGTTQELAIRAYEVNLVLGLFNLIPIPPLDGSRIVGAVMGDATYARWISLDQVGMLVLFGVIFLFQREFFLVFGTVLDESTRAMVTLVGG